jgi:hypothetical protein
MSGSELVAVISTVVAIGLLITVIVLGVLYGLAVNKPDDKPDIINEISETCTSKACIGAGKRFVLQI